MAIDIVRGLALEPILTHNFEVRIQGVLGGEDMKFRAQRATVPGFSFTSEPRLEGNLKVHYAMEEEVDKIQVTWIEEQKGPVWAFAQEWRALTRSNLRFRKMPFEYKKRMQIIHLDRRLRPDIAIAIKGAFIERLNPYTVDYTDNGMVEIVMDLSVDRVEALPVGLALTVLGLV